MKSVLRIVCFIVNLYIIFVIYAGISVSPPAITRVIARDLALEMFAYCIALYCIVLSYVSRTSSVEIKVCLLADNGFISQLVV